MPRGNDSRGRGLCVHFAAIKSITGTQQQGCLE